MYHLRNIKVIVKDFSVRDRHFVIVRDVHSYRYFAVEDKYIGADGRLVKELCGAHLFPSMDLDGCLKLVRDCVEIEYLESQGVDRAAAFARVYGLPLTPELCAAFN